MGAWWDEFHSAYARELGRMLIGETTKVDRGPGQFTVASIKSVIVGIDSDGIFAAVNVYDEDGYAWSLYSNGTVCEYESDREVGRHNLKTKPIIEAPVSLAEQAKDMAHALHLAQFGGAA